jgi:hypothetical protein
MLACHHPSKGITLHALAAFTSMLGLCDDQLPSLTPLARSLRLQRYRLMAESVAGKGLAFLLCKPAPFLQRVQQAMPV